MSENIKYIIEEQERLLEKNEQIVRYIRECINNIRNNSRRASDYDASMVLDAISEYNNEYMDTVIEMEDAISEIQDDILYELSSMSK